MEEKSDTMAGFGLMAHGVDQLLAGKRSAQSYQREKSMMKLQNQMNRANMVDAPSMQVEGLRMAGFNPAMVAGAGSQPAPTVSKGTADMAQTLPLDMAGLAQLSLMDAQRDNIEAQTEKTKAETANLPKTGANIEADTNEKIARTLLYPEQRENVKADTTLKTEQADKVKEEAQSIRNTNEVFEEENKGISLFGQTMAMDWQKQDWYKNLPSGTKMVIDQVAEGKVPLSVGSMRALVTAIDTDRGMNDMEKSKVEAAMARAIIKSQMNDKNVMDALKRDPKVRVEMNENQAKKLLAEANKLSYKMEKIIDLELQGKVYENQKAKEEAIQSAVRKVAEKAGNMDYARANGDYGNYAWRALENLTASVVKIVELVLMGKFAKGALAPQLPDVRTESSTKTRKYPDNEEPVLYDANNRRVQGTGGSTSYQETVRHAPGRAPGFPQE